MNGCGCECRPGRGHRFASRPTREERIELLEEKQRDLQQQAANVAEEIKWLNEAAGTAS